MKIIKCFVFCTLYAIESDNFIEFSCFERYSSRDADEGEIADAFKQNLVYISICVVELV